MEFVLDSTVRRKRAFREIRRLILRDLTRGRIPTYHILRINRDGDVSNHYMTPISLEPVNERGDKMIWVQDFEFFLKLFLRLKKVTRVEYDSRRPAVIFTYEE